MRWHLASFFCIAAGSLLALLTPLVPKWMIDQVLPQRETGLLLGAAVLIFASYQGRTALTSTGNYLRLNAVQKMAFRMRMELLRHLDKVSANYYESTPPGSVMYPFKEPVDEVAYFGSDLLPHNPANVRVFDVNAGSIRVDGVDIRDLQLKSLRTNVCYLPRDPVLFDGSVASNLRFVRPAASDEELDEVIQLADLARVVASRGNSSAHWPGRMPLGRRAPASGDRQSSLTAAMHIDPGRGDFLP